MYYCEGSLANYNLSEDIFLVPSSEGTLYNTTNRFSEELQSFQKWVIMRLLGLKIVHFDETGINIGGDLHWLHSSSTALLTYYFFIRREDQKHSM